MSESEDDEIFDDEELSESEHSGSIKGDDEMGSEFDENNDGSGMRSPKQNASES